AALCRVAPAARADAPDHGLSRRQRRVPLGPLRRGGPRHGRLPRRLRGRRGGDPYRWDVRQRLTRSQTHRAQRAPRAPPAARPRRRPRRSRLPRRRSGRTGGHVGAWRSDLTATLLARALGAREVSLWKDVPGVLTADPRIVPDARVIPQLHVREAAELAYYGAKVLHPRALVPVLRRSVAVRIRPFAEPASLGTEISRRRTLNAYPVKALSAIPKQALLTVTGSGMLGVPGIAARAFAAVHHEGISVSLISQASSEQSICFSVPEDQAERARRGLDEAFRREIGRQEIDRVEVRAGAATLVVVGLGMAGTPGIAARVFSALAEAK